MNEFGIIGLGVMGRNISLNFMDKGFKLAVYNKNDSLGNPLLESFIDAYGKQYSFDTFTDLKKLASSLSRPRKILMMIKAGNAVDQVLAQLQDWLDPGDIIIDGGNSHFRDTIRRTEVMNRKSIHFMGCGISGGEQGARFGPSMMPGGDYDAFRKVAPYLEAVAAKDAHGEACCKYTGPDGAGHFVKMVHNGIEYAEMQVLAECYDFMRQSRSNEEIADEFESWIKQGRSSYLLEITIDILRKKESGGYLLDLILDKAGNKGTGSWSSIASLELGSCNSMMAAAVYARYTSSYKSERVKYAGKVSRPETNHGSTCINWSELAYFASLVNHHQGFELLRMASVHFGWKLNLEQICRSWTEGCIIRSALMKKCVAYFHKESRLFDNKEVFDFLKSKEKTIQEALQKSIESCVPTPCISSAYNYWISMTRENLPANLIQAQRDYFGAHTYERRDREEGLFFHTEWES